MYALGHMLYARPTGAYNPAVSQVSGGPCAHQSGDPVRLAWGERLTYNGQELACRDDLQFVNLLELGQVLVTSYRRTRTPVRYTMPRLISRANRRAHAYSALPGASCPMNNKGSQISRKRSESPRY